MVPEGATRAVLAPEPADQPCVHSLVGQGWGQESELQPSPLGWYQSTCLGWVVPTRLPMGRAAGVRAVCWQTQGALVWDVGPLPAVFHGRCFRPLCCSRIAFSFILLGLILLMSSESTSRQSIWGTFAGNCSFFFKLVFCCVDRILSSLFVAAEIQCLSLRGRYQRQSCHNSTGKSA